MYAMAAENLGMLALEEQRYGDAIHHFEQSIAFAREIGMVEVVAASLEGLVATLAQQQRHEDAAVIAGAADRARSTNEVTPLQDYEHQIAARTRETLRKALEERNVPTEHLLKAPGRRTLTKQRVGLCGNRGSIEPGRSRIANEIGDAAQHHFPGIFASLRQRALAVNVRLDVGAA